MSRAVALAAAVLAQVAAAQPIREVIYDPMKEIRIPVARGVPTHVELEQGETIASEVVAGLTSVCDVGDNAEVPEGAWYVCGAVGGSDIYVKPIGTSRFNNPVSFKTNRRSYSITFVPVASEHQAARRVIVRGAPPAPPDPGAAQMAAAMAMLPRPEEILQSRMEACPQVVNASYTVATARNRKSQDIKPEVVFDDGRFTYLRFPGNAPLPIPLEAGDPEVAFTPSMKCGYMVVDRVVRELMLRLGAEGVVSVVNTAFDIQGRPPAAGSAVDGVELLVRDPKTGQFRKAEQ